MAAAVVGAAAAALVVFGYVQAATLFHDSETYQQRVLACQDRALHRLPRATQDAATVDLLEHVSEYCYDDQRRIDQVSESSIRRGLYIHQRYENNVILFMVVLITLSGAALAGVQLLTSYNLAATGHLGGVGATDLCLEQGRLSIKSSVTGLVVLALSLALFGIYIVKVYSIVPSPDAKDLPASQVALRRQTRRAPTMPRARLRVARSRQPKASAAKTSAKTSAAKHQRAGGRRPHSQAAAGSPNPSGQEPNQGALDPDRRRMIFPSPLQRGVLVQRYKRFLGRCGAGRRRGDHRPLPQYRRHAWA